MLKCEGYKMFHGRMKINPVSGNPFLVGGTWLYKPGTDCWYCDDAAEYPFGASFEASVCEVEYDSGEQ